MLLFAITFTACKKKDQKQDSVIKVEFIADGQVFKTLEVKDAKDIVFPEAPIKNGYSFNGWYFNDDIWKNPVTEQSLRDVINRDIIKVYASFIADSQNLTYKRVDADGAESETGSYIIFGEYPQTIKANQVKVNESNTDDRGYFLGSDGSYYAKIVAEKFFYANNDYKFSDNTVIIDEDVYYFKVEPIKWRILNEKNGKALILCESIIAKQAFGDTNNYKESKVRAWLNDEFYKKAFSSLQMDLIEITNVDNSLESTGNHFSNEYICENTDDKIFLLSNKELAAAEYGFASDQSRIRKVTDYTIAAGAYIRTNIENYWNGEWFSRSPLKDANAVQYVKTYGEVALYSTDPNIGASSGIGVAPALVIKL